MIWELTLGNFDELGLKRYLVSVQQEEDCPTGLRKGVKEEL